MELAADPRALLLGGELGVQLPFALELRGPLGERRGQQAARADRPADEPGADRDEQDRDVDVVVGRGVHGEPEAGDERDEDRPADAPRQGHAQRDGLEIASALVVSDATAKTHVKHILAKLGLDNRVQAVVYAYESGVVTPGAG